MHALRVLVIQPHYSKIPGSAPVMYISDFTGQDKNAELIYHSMPKSSTLVN